MFWNLKGIQRRKEGRIKASRGERGFPYFWTSSTILLEYNASKNVSNDLRDNEECRCGHKDGFRGGLGTWYTFFIIKICIMKFGHHQIPAVMSY